MEEVKTMTLDEKIDKIEPGKFYDLDTMEVLSNKEIKDLCGYNKLTKFEMVYGTTVLSLAAYGGYSLYKSIKGFVDRKRDPDKALLNEIERLRKKYPGSEISIKEDDFTEVDE